MEEKFCELLDDLLVDIDVIDGQTPWQNMEPEWWLQMMELRKMTQRFKDGYDND